LKTLTKLTFPVILAAFLALTGCLTPQTGQVYTRGQAQQSLNVYYGTIIDIRPATIKAKNSGLGTVLGGVAGGVAGSTIGHGAGSTLAAVGGALAGAATGNLIEDQAGTKPALEFTIKLEDGRVLAVVQEKDQEANYFRVGDRVRLLESPDGTLRVRQ